jgi:hypothetical protein
MFKDLTADMRIDRGAKEQEINHHGVKKVFEKELPVLLYYNNSESSR